MVYFKLFSVIQVYFTQIIAYFDKSEDQDGSEASVSVLSLLSLYPVMSIDHNLAENPLLLILT